MASMTELITPKRQAQTHSAVERIGVFVKEPHGDEGGLNNPMSWDRTVDKFHWLSEAFTDEDLRNRLIQVVLQLDARPISDLMDSLARVQCTAAFPRAPPVFNDRSVSMS